DEYVLVEDRLKVAFGAVLESTTPIRSLSRQSTDELRDLGGVEQGTEPPGNPSRTLPCRIPKLRGGVRSGQAVQSSQGNSSGAADGQQRQHPGQVLGKWPHFECAGLVSLERFARPLKEALEPLATSPPSTGSFPGPFKGKVRTEKPRQTDPLVEDEGRRPRRHEI